MPDESRQSDSDRLDGQDPEDAVNSATRERLQALYENVNLLGELGYEVTGETQYVLLRGLEGTIGELRAENDALKAEAERLHAALTGAVSDIYADCGACLGGGKATFHPCEWCAENRRDDAARASVVSDEQRPALEGHCECGWKLIGPHDGDQWCTRCTPPGSHPTPEEDR